MGSEILLRLENYCALLWQSAFTVSSICGDPKGSIAIAIVGRVCRVFPVAPGTIDSGQFSCAADTTQLDPFRTQ
ncbi:hypothetical protein [Novosphingobium malaysiense]|uniref:hypothetical protein n=1 Tax=Novosphingobium malaysiense TaxID=1348853 RepID=UPI001E64B5CC|nr:hypothetical protein [Novosphingobium malaysiense]